MTTQVKCDCERGWYDPGEYSSCYTCFLRRENYMTCIFCGKWHSPEYSTCFNCRVKLDRDEAGRNLRYDIMIRDDFTCQSCGTHDDLQIDHIQPCARGGTADPWNLQVLCRDCNQIKGAEFDWDWDHRRTELMHLYFTFGWRRLDDNEREQLRGEARRSGWTPSGMHLFGWHSHYQQKPSIADTEAMQFLADQYAATCTALRGRGRLTVRVEVAA